MIMKFALGEAVAIKDWLNALLPITFKSWWYYIYALANQVMAAGELKKYHSLTKKLRRDLRKKLHCHHADLNLTHSTHSWLYEMAYPKEMRVYWMIRAQKDKLLRKNRRKSL